MEKSVCIATYNGALYIREQIASILNQLDKNDEVIVCDDRSSDETVRLIEDFKDARIKIYVNDENLGYVRNFEKCISLANNEYIFLSDQDDVWTPGRVNDMMNIINLSPKNMLVASNFDLINQMGEKIGEFRSLGKVKKYKWLQILSIFLGRSPYFGCTFLIKKKALEYCLPIPTGIESHDIWISLVVSALGGVTNIADATLKHRVHENNVTTRKRRALMIILKSRLKFAYALARRMSQSVA